MNVHLNWVRGGKKISNFRPTKSSKILKIHVKFRKNSLASLARLHWNLCFPNSASRSTGNVRTRSVSHFVKWSLIRHCVLFARDPFSLLLNPNFHCDKWFFILFLVKRTHTYSGSDPQESIVLELSCFILYCNVVVWATPQLLWDQHPSIWR